MRTVNAYSYIIIGLAIRLFRNLDGDVSKSFVLDHLEQLENSLKSAGLNVSLHSLSLLDKTKAKIVAIEENKSIGKDLANDFRDIFRSIENTTFSESSLQKIYVTAQLRFNTTCLDEKPELLFADGVYKALSTLARADVRDACHCLLFGQATACAFHILRATEDTLRQYYYAKKKAKRLKNPMWGPMVSELRTLQRKNIPEGFLNSLDHIRQTYRNPTQHPEARYDLQSAQDVFGLCIDVINQMHRTVDKEQHPPKPIK